MRIGTTWREWEALERQRRLEASCPTTTDPLWDRLPNEVAELIVHLLKEASGCSDLGSVWYVQGDELAAYQGLVGLSMVSRHLHALITLARSVDITFRLAGLKGRFTLQVPL